MRIVVIGSGSAGQRHARIARELGWHVELVSRRSDVAAHRTISQALGDGMADIVVVANRTADHAESLRELASSGFDGMVLVEKPLTNRLETIPVDGFEGVFVAYNLRFHPVVRRLRDLLGEEKVFAAQARAGQYLPDWRPDRDFRGTYSARIAQGGGVLRDLSHELDYLTWILGDWRRVAAISGQLGSLEIDSDDLTSVLLTTERCAALALEVNYYDRPARRTVVANTACYTVEADLRAGEITIDGRVEHFRSDQDDTYREQLLALGERRLESLCDARTGREIVRLIEAVERSAREERWVSR